MRKVLALVLIVLFSIQSLWALSPQQYLEYCVKGEKTYRETNKEFGLFAGTPLLLGSLLIKDNGLKVAMLGLGGIAIGSSLFYPQSSLEKQYLQNKNTMNDETAIMILKDYKKRILFSRRMTSIFLHVKQVKSFSMNTRLS